MPPKFANLKPEEVIRALKRGGFYVHETSGSHVQMKHPTKPGRVTIPYHKRFDLLETYCEEHRTAGGIN